MDFKEKYNSLLSLVENKLNDYIKISDPMMLYEPFRYILESGGKRIRPVLTMLAAGAAGGKPEKAVDYAAAIEILHNFTLVHDDIMDRSPLRRGRETIHLKWNEPVAILTGDIMVGYAYQLLYNKIHHSKQNEIIKEFTNALIEVCEGQAYDMDFNERMDIVLNNYLLMITKKTAKLLEASAVIGGLSAGADETQIIHLRNFAANLGLGFQIQDDLLDITADQSNLGKKTGQDIIEGKKTFLILTALKNAKSEKDKQLLDRFYSNNGLGEEYIRNLSKCSKGLMYLISAMIKSKIIFKNHMKLLKIWKATNIQICFSGYWSH